MKLASVAALAALIASIVAWSQSTSGRTSFSGRAGNSGAQSMKLIMISDEHLEFNPYVGNQTDSSLGGTLDPTHMINRVRSAAATADYILLAGDFGHHSSQAEYQGFWIQSSTAVTSTGTGTTVTANASPSYSEFGLTPNANTTLWGAPSGTNVQVNTWASAYDDVNGSNFEIVKLTAVTNTTVTATFTKTHPVGFLLRAHAMSEYWDFMLQGKVLGSTGNHDSETQQAYCGIGSAPACSDPHFNNLPVNLLSAFAPYGMFGGQTVKPYWSKKLNALLSVVAVDTMGSLDFGGDGVAYGSTQELALRNSANTPGLGSVWTISIQHHPPRTICTSGVATSAGALGSAVDAAFCGHMHLSQVLMVPQCIGSGCTSTKLVPMTDLSGYTYMANDPTSECTFSAGTGAQTLVLNSSNGGSGLERTYGVLTVDAHNMVFNMYDQNGVLVSDYLTPSSKATWTLTK